MLVVSRTVWVRLTFLSCVLFALRELHIHQPVTTESNLSSRRQNVFRGILDKNRGSKKIGRFTVILFSSKPLFLFFPPKPIFSPYVG